MEREMIIVLDIDGVLYNFDKTAHYMIARHMGYKLREDMPWTHKVYWRGAPQEEWDWLWQSENIDALFRHGHLYRGAIEFARDLAKLGEVHLVTKRPGNAVRVTLDWARYNWDHDFPFEEVRIIGKNQSKAIVKGDVYIDDHLKNLLEVDGARILVDRPWNQKDLGKEYAKTGIQVWRAYELDDVLRRAENVRSQNRG